MTETSKFWNGTTVGDALVEAPYDAPTEFAAMMSAVAWGDRYANKGGVWRDTLNSLQTVVAGANNVRTLTGRGVNYGTWYSSDAVINTTIPTPGGATRVDYIVLRKDWTAQTVRVTRIAGVEGAGIPALVQSAGTTWDVPLATASITTGGVITITDMRQFLAEVSLVNLLVNGGDEIAQRGTGPITVDLAYAGDRWQNVLVSGTSTLSWSQITSTIGTKGKSSQLTYVHVAAGARSYRQTLKLIAGEYIQLQGKTVSYSRKVKSTVAGTIRLALKGDVSGSTYSAYNVGTGEETLTVTKTLSATDSYLYVEDLMDVATATAEVNDAMLVISPVPVDYVPLTPAEELARCLRYYEKFGMYGSGGGNFPYCVGYGSAGATSGTPLMFSVQKTITPTMTKAGTWNLLNCAQPTVSNTSVNGTTLSCVITATLDWRFYPDSADDLITAEANP